MIQLQCIAGLHLKHKLKKKLGCLAELELKPPKIFFSGVEFELERTQRKLFQFIKMKFKDQKIVQKKYFLLAMPCTR